MKKILLLCALIASLFHSPMWAADTFIVRDIEVEGSHRISPATIYNYLPIKTGQVLHADERAALIKALYKTGFFSQISLSRRGNTLIVTVMERPIIGQLKISGNSAIATDKLTTVMKNVNVAEGRVYDRAVLDKIKQSLLNQYYQLGRYNARVDVTATPMERNRVFVKIDISEGLIAKVERINIIGNKVFSEKTLIKQLDLTTRGLFTFFTQTDRFSQEKLESSLENLRNFYLDHGYIKIMVKSSQVAITPDRKAVYVTIAIDEGPQYHVEGVKLSGNLILPEAELQKSIRIRPGDVFSRQAILNAEKSLSTQLGNKGYIFAIVALHPKVDEKNKQVFVIFNVTPGRQAYVRHIYFTNNIKTNDEVFRHKIEQMESAVVSSGKLENSKHALSLLPYVKNVEMTIHPVPEHSDVVDVDYKVTEDNAAQATFNVGYSQIDRFILGIGLNQKNFLGTGKTLGINATRSRYQHYLGLEYTDPYYTEDGISRSINLSASSINPKYANLTSTFSTNQYNASVVYTIPIGQEKDAFNNVQLGYGYEDTVLLLSNGFNNTVDLQLNQFITQHHRHFQQLDLISGISRDSRDKAVFPTSGMIQSLGFNIFLPIVKSSLTYYTLAYELKNYYPLNDDFIITTRGNLGYGSGFNNAQEFPLFKNYYAGGIGSVRGYGGNTLGPKDGSMQPTGGNFLVTGSIGLIFPNHITDNLRTSVFVDAGNTYNTFNNRPLNGTASGPMRLSSGVEADWISPMGLVAVSLAKPINRLHGRGAPSDNEEIFQFSLGANFG